MLYLPSPPNKISDETLDLFRKDLEHTGDWNPEWNQSFISEWQHAQEMWADLYQRGI